MGNDFKKYLTEVGMKNRMRTPVGAWKIVIVALCFVAVLLLAGTSACNAADAPNGSYKKT